MTPKHLISVDLKEIPSLEVHCGNCRSMLTLPIMRENVPASQLCPGCNQPLWGREDSSIFNNLRDLVIGLSHWQRREGAKFALVFSIPLDRPTDRG